MSRKPEFVAVSATKGKVTVSLREKVKNIYSEKLNEIFEKNACMQNIYPEDTRTALEVFCIYEAEGGEKMEFQWLKEESRIMKEGDKITIIAPPKSDFFHGAAENNEEGFLPEILSNAPFYHTEVVGDFVMKAKVSHDFKDVYDSASIMVMKDLDCWAKACFEHTDFHTHAVVSVVTNGVSDDANGCNLDGNSVWLQICRVKNDFAFHYSVDGERFYMMRQFHLPAEPTVKVGLLAQAPIGNGGERIYEFLSIENRTVKNIRAGR